MNRVKDNPMREIIIDNSHSIGILTANEEIIPII
jgi:hypothetical protein